MPTAPHYGTWTRHSRQFILQGLVELCEKSIWFAPEYVYLPGGGPLGPKLYPPEEHGVGKISGLLSQIAGKLLKGSEGYGKISIKWATFGVTGL